jgi:hypothetical protein
MKSSLAGALIALQLATVGLVVGVLLKRNDAASGGLAELTERVERLASGLQGSLNHQQQIAIYLDALRQQWQQVPLPAAKGDPAAGQGSGAVEGSAPAATEGAAPAAPAAGSPGGGAALMLTPPSPFPKAAESLAKLKLVVKQRSVELAGGGRNLGPLDAELAKCRDDLIARGHEAIYVVRREIDLQPFEPERDAAFVEYLLASVVPPLSSNAKDEAFDLARSALVRATNEPNLKHAAAVALQQIDGRLWSKDVLDVIAMGSAREVSLRALLLGMFIEHPSPEVVSLCVRFIDDARYPPELRNKAIEVLGKQDASAVNPALRRVIFEEQNPLMRIHAFDTLWARLADAPGDRAKLLDDVLAADRAQMPDALVVKVQNLKK